MIEHTHTLSSSNVVERERERVRQSVRQHSVSNCLHQIALAFTQMAVEERKRDVKEGRGKGGRGEVRRHQGRRVGVVRWRKGEWMKGGKR